jgi:hypothetical protein
VSVNIDNAVSILGLCLAEAEAARTGQTTTDGKRVTTSLVRAIDRSRNRALDIQ